MPCRTPKAASSGWRRSRSVTVSQDFVFHQENFPSSVQRHHFPDGYGRGNATPAFGTASRSEGCLKDTFNAMKTLCNSNLHEVSAGALAIKARLRYLFQIHRRPFPQGVLAHGLKQWNPFLAVAFAFAIYIIELNRADFHIINDQKSGAWAWVGRGLQKRSIPLSRAVAVTSALGAVQWILLPVPQDPLAQCLSHCLA